MSGLWGGTGYWGLLVSMGWAPGFFPSPLLFLSPPIQEGGRSGLRRGIDSQGLDPSPGRKGLFRNQLCPANPKFTSQPLSPALGPQLQAEESQRERRGGRECSDILAFSTSLSVFPSVSLALTGPSWVLCEHTDFRGRQWLVGSCEITNWLTYSGTQRVGSLYPIKQVGSMSG